MVTVAKQRPSPKRRPTPKPVPSRNGPGARTADGGVTGEAPLGFSSIAGAIDDFIHICLYGKNRVGKTTLACQFEKPLALVSFEPSTSGGARSVKKVPGVFLRMMKTKEQAVELANELMEDEFFKTVLVDSATSLQDVILAELMGLEDVPVQLDWGTVPEDMYRTRSEQAKEVLRIFTRLPKHVIITAKEKDHNPPREGKEARVPKMVRGPRVESYFAADLGSATAEWLQDACDYVGRLYVDKETITKYRTTVVNKGTKNEKTIKTSQEVETGKMIRRLLTMNHPNFAAGFRSENPEAIPLWINNPTYSKIAAIVRGERVKDGYYPSSEESSALE